ncbi:MAG: glycosyltransferase family 39 protein [Panacibacter sp.]
MRVSIQRYFPLLVLLGIVLNATGLFNDVLEPDGTLYAAIAKHMVLSNDWINLIGDNHDWLDKPHFPFWITAFSYKVFGINSFAYKFPAFLFWLLGIRFTYLLAKELYNTTVAQVAVLAYIIALHSFLANFDVRAEPYLTTLTIGSIYYMYKVYKEKKITYLLLAAFLAACAVMTKGIFALLTIGGGFVVHWIVNREWKEFINYRWYLLLLLILVFIVPELYCLYVQFDLHPEKIVFDRTGVSGIKFFFWDSQFGRFFNTGPIQGSGDISFFLHTTLWAFLPWSIVFYIAVIRLFRRDNKLTKKAQWIIFGSTGLTFLLFSFSKFQLPHYIIILFPQFAIIAADYLVTLFEGTKLKAQRAIFILQSVILIIAAFAVIFLCIYLQLTSRTLIIFLTAFALTASFIVFRKISFINMCFRSFAFAIILYPFLNFVFYPYIMQYQSGMVAARWLNDHNYKAPFAMYKEFMHSFEFYADGEPAWLYNNDDLKKFSIVHLPYIIYAARENIDSLQLAGFKVTVLENFEYYRISMLTGSFLNPATRNATTKKMALLQVTPGQKQLHE